MRKEGGMSEKPDSKLPFSLTDSELRDTLLSSWLPRIGDRPSLYSSLIPMPMRGDAPEDKPIDTLTPIRHSLVSHPMVSSSFDPELMNPDSELNKRMREKMQAVLEGMLRHGDGEPPILLKFPKIEIERTDDPIEPIMWRLRYSYGFNQRASYVVPTDYDEGGLSLEAMLRVAFDGYPEETECRVGEVEPVVRFPIDPYPDSDE
jgi:hypothetical protein